MGVQPLDYARSVARVGPRTSKFAVAAASCPVFAVSAVFAFKRWPSITVSGIAFCWTLVAVLIVGFVIGLIASQRCADSNGRLRGEAVAIVGAVSSALLLIPALWLTGLAYMMSEWGSPG